MTLDDLRPLSETFADALDPEIMKRARGNDRLAGRPADSAAVVRLDISVDAVEWVDRVQRALVRTAVPTRLDLGFTARSGVDLRRASGRPPLSMMPREYLTPAAEDRAVEVQELLADRGRHRAPSPSLIYRSPPSRSGSG